MNLKIRDVFHGTNLIFFTILILACALRLLNVGKELTSDEKNIYLALSDLVDIIPRLISVEIYPPLTYFLIHFWTYISESSAWIRLYFIFFGIGLCIAVWYLGKEYLDEKFGLIAFFIAACSPFLIWVSGYARSYVDSGLFITLSTLFFLKILRGNNSRYIWAGYFLSALTSLYMFYFTGVVLISQNLFFFLRLRKYKNIVKKWIITQTLLAVCLIPGFIMFLSQAKNIADKGLSPSLTYHGLNILGIRVGKLMRTLASLVGLDPYFANWRVTQYINKDILILASLCFILVIAIIFYTSVKSFARIKRVDITERWFFPTLIMGIILIVVLANALLPLKAFNCRYHTATHVLFIFVLSSFIRTLSSRNIGIVLIALFCLNATRLTEIYRPEIEYRRAADYLNSRKCENACLLFFGDVAEEWKKSLNCMDIVAVRKYFSRDRYSGNYLPLSQNIQNELGAILSPYHEVYLYIHAMLERYGPYEYIDNWLLEKGYHLVSKEKFHGIKIAQYEK